MRADDLGAGGFTPPHQPHPAPALRTTLNGLSLCDWPLPEVVHSRGMVLIVHGLGEHMGRYDAVARELNAWGFAVRGYDQYGHGLSAGVRGSLPSATKLLDDLTAVVAHTHSNLANLGDRLGANKRLIVVGHSLGGLVASRWVSLQAQPETLISGLVLSSPAFDAGLNWAQKILVAVLPHLLPNLRVSNGLNAAYLSHDLAQVAAYKADPLVHDRIAARLARFISDAGPTVLLTKAKGWTVKTLLLYAGDDKLVSPEGSRVFEALAPADLVDSHCFEPLYHELLNEAEPGRTQVLAALKRWLDVHFR